MALIAEATWSWLLWHPKTWLTVGFLGQAIFTARFLVQWCASEREGDSVVPVAFWWISLAGGLTLLAYAAYRRDPPIIVGQVMGLFVYARNLMLIARKRRCKAALRRSGGGRLGAQAEELLDGQPEVGGTHQGFPHEDGRDALGFEAFDIGAAADAALADQDDIRRDAVPEAQGQIEVGDEPAEVAVVDPHEVGAGGQDPRQVRLVVQFDQCRHAERPARARSMASWPSSRISAIRRTASAPAIRASTT